MASADSSESAQFPCSGSSGIDGHRRHRLRMAGYTSSVGLHPCGSITKRRNAEFHRFAERSRLDALRNCDDSGRLAGSSLNSASTAELLNFRAQSNVVSPSFERNEASAPFCSSKRTIDRRTIGGNSQHQRSHSPYILRIDFDT